MYFSIQSIHAIAGAGGKGFLGPLPVPAAKVDRQKPPKKGGNIT